MAKESLRPSKVWFSYLSKIFLLVFLFFYFFLPNSVFAAPLTDSMSGYWKFDGSAQDSSGHGNSATLYGAPAPTYVAGQTMSFTNTNSVSFTSNNYISVDANPVILKPTMALTFSLWVNVTTMPSTTTAIGGEQFPGYNNGYFFALDPSGFASFSLGNGTVTNTATSTTAIPLNSWTLLTGVWDYNLSTIKIYVNGLENNTVAVSGYPVYTSTLFQLGHFSGMMDDVRLYDRVLTPAEISALASRSHTSANWVGNQSANYEDSLNWNPEYVPDPYTLVTIATTGIYQPEFTTDESMAKLIINPSTSLDLHYHNLKINDPGASPFSNDGTLKLESLGSQNIINLTMDTNSGTVEIDNTANISNFITGSTYNNLILNGTGTVTLSAALVINGNLNLANGYLDDSASNVQVNVKGDWIKGSGQFIPGTSTVNLNGSNQTIYGANTFYNLTKISSVSDGLGFMYGATQTITHNLTLQGPGASYLNLRSSVPGTQWKIDPQGTRTLTNLDVKDSNNINSTKISAITGNIINSGNNTNWLFDTVPPTITLNSYSAITSNTKLPITGTTLELSSKVAFVEFQMDSISGGGWTNCTANDSAFDSASEAFTCTPTLVLSNGAHLMYIRATDTDGYVTTSANYSIASFDVDTTIPAISAVSANENDDKATISWSTDKDSSSQVEYGKTTTYGKETSEADTVTRVQNHSVSLTNLSSCTTYHYRVKSNDAYSNQAVSADYDFKTTGCSACDNPGKPKIDDAAATGTDAIKISFTQADGTVKHYELKYGTKSGSYEWGVDDVGDDNTDYYTIGKLSADTTYYFKIRAVNSCGNGDWSSEISGKTDALTADTTSSSSTSESVTAADTSNSSLPTAQTSQASSSSATTPIATVTPNFNGTTSEDWQVKYFGSAYCYNQSKCGGGADPDGDGISNDEEFRLGTDPLSADSDNDGIADAQEIESGHDPIKSATNAGGDAIVYESPKESGEVKKDIYTVKNVEVVDDSGKKKLKITGKGPPDTYVTVFIYSDPIVLTIKTDSDGNWSYVLDQEIGDGQHEVYVAVTDSKGKVAEKSEPLAFVKTAEAVTIIPPAEAAAAKRAESPTEVWYKQGIFSFIMIVVAGLMLALGSIGIYKYRMSKKIETGEAG
jgi:hypothetical protein